MDKKILLISDSTGETAEQIMIAILVHFDMSNTDIIRKNKINSKEQIDEVFKTLTGDVLIFSTLIKDELVEYLYTKSKQNNYEVIDVLKEPLDLVSNFLSQSPKKEVGLRRRLSDQYFHKIECVEFTVKYDDGKDPRGALKADIVIIGVSRTSKTPVSLNLAFKNYKVCNIPLVPEIEPPKELFMVDSKKVIGLIINEKKLNEIRNERLKEMGLSADVPYADNNRITKEINFGIDVMNKVGCEIIDVSSRTIEETAKEILEKLNLLN